MNSKFSPSISPSLKNKFTPALLGWNRDKNDRKMPWKGEKDPYKIWLSEIILQQTRVDQGLDYYNKFITAFPDIHKLAEAAPEKVLKLWEGLGYYSRCRNLMITARTVSGEHNGVFPADYEKIRSLKGIGPYTAAAISSFAFNLPYAVVDGNVFRVLSRVFGIDKPIDTTEGKKYFSALAEELLDKKMPGVFNQAIMDFGAMVCKPASPDCSTCVFRKQCKAFQSGTVNKLPVKKKRITIRSRWFYYIVMEYKGELAISQRTNKDIWQQLYEFPLIEAKNELVKQVIVKKAIANQWLQSKQYEDLQLSSLYKHQLSHQLIKGQFVKLRLMKKPVQVENWIWVKKDKLKDYAFPRVISRYLEGI